MIFVKVIQPKPIKEKELRGYLLGEQRKIGAEVKKDYQATVRTWGNKPKFVAQQSLAGGSASLFVGLEGTGSKAEQVWNMLDKGTKPHVILPGAVTGKSNKKSLRFPGVYTAKTMPGVLGSKGGGASGDPVFAKKVNHPGTKARKWEKAIAKKWTKPYAVRMQKAMDAGVRASGHRYP